MRVITLAITGLAITGLAIATANAAVAQTTPTSPTAAAAPALAAGASIYDPQGNEIAKVDSVAGANVIVSTGTNKLTIPASSFGAGAKGPVIAATKDQLDAAAAQAATASKAALATALKPGATVTGANGTAIGTVKTVDANLVEVSTPKGAVKLPQTAFAVASGGVTIGMTAAEFDAAVTAVTKPG